MDRAALEALSATDLQKLIAEAAAVLADRAAAATSAASPGGAARPAGGGAEAISGAPLFTFGASSAGSPGSIPLTGLFAFGSTSASSTASQGSLFGSGGTGCGGLFAPPTRGASIFGSMQGGRAVVAATSKLEDAPEKQDCEEDGDGERVLEEEVTAIHGWTPSMTLEIVGNIQTGEEGEEQLYCQRSKLYRFKDGEWKERGLGDARLLKDQASGKVRFLLRQEKTGKVVANHYVLDTNPYCDLRPNADSEKIWVWCAQDFADGELAVEELALKFGSVELAGQFKEAWDSAKVANAKALISS